MWNYIKNYNERNPKIKEGNKAKLYNEIMVKAPRSRIIDANYIKNYNERNPKIKEGNKAKLYNEIMVKEAPRSRIIDAKLYKKITVKEIPRPKKETKQNYIMKLW